MANSVQSNSVVCRQRVKEAIAVDRAHFHLILAPQPRIHPGHRRPVAEEARCVLITSGTLSPMAGMEGELGTAFPVRLEAKHVIPAAQLHVEAMGALGDVVNDPRSPMSPDVFSFLSILDDS